MKTETKACRSFRGCSGDRLIIMNTGIETERTVLTLLAKEDFAEMLSMLMDPETSHHIRHLHLRQKEEYETVLQNRLEQIRTEKGFHWVGRLKTTYELVGAVNLSLIPGTDKMQLGFQLNQKFWNKGFATELASAILRFGVPEKGLSKIYGVFTRDNTASKKVLEKLGFEPETIDPLKEENVITYRYLTP